MGDYIKLYRQLLESSVFDNANLLKVWIYCLLKATHKERDVLIGNQIVHLEKGQFIFGVNVASAALKIPHSSLHRYMKTLQSLGNIGMKSGNKYSVVTVENWASYQLEESEVGCKWDANGMQMGTNNNIKNIYNEKPSKKFSKPSVNEIEQYCKEKGYSINAQYFFDYYESKGWVLGKSPMKDWKASVRTWVNNSNKTAQPEKPKIKYEV